MKTVLFTISPLNKTATCICKSFLQDIFTENFIKLIREIKETTSK